MGHYKTYISSVVQKLEQHVHDFAIVDFQSPKYNFYLDIESQQVVEWANKKQTTLPEGEKLIILYYLIAL